MVQPFNLGTCTLFDFTLSSLCSPCSPCSQSSFLCLETMSTPLDWIGKLDKSLLEIFALVRGLNQRIQQINIFLTLVGTGLSELKANKQCKKKKNKKLLCVHEQNLEF